MYVVVWLYVCLCARRGHQILMPSLYSRLSLYQNSPNKLRLSVPERVCCGFHSAHEALNQTLVSLQMQTSLGLQVRVSAYSRALCMEEHFCSVCSLLLTTQSLCRPCESPLSAIPTLWGSCRPV